MSIADTNRGMRGLEFTQEDQCVFAERLDEVSDYQYAISDRNDAAVMLARTVLAASGCKTTRNRTMPA